MKNRKFSVIINLISVVQAVFVQDFQDRLLIKINYTPEKSAEIVNGFASYLALMSALYNLKKRWQVRRCNCTLSDNYSQLK